MTINKWEGFPGTQVPFRRLFRKIERPLPEGASIVTAYTNGQVTLRSNRAKVGYHEATDLSSFQGVRPGDFVVHGLDILRGSVGVSDSVGALSSVCTVCEPLNVDGRFMAYVMRLQAQSGLTRAMARGVREGGADFRRWDTLAELPLPVVSINDQRRIADFLDERVARIDHIIAARTRQGVNVRDAAYSQSTALMTGKTDGWIVGPLRRFVRSEDWRRVPLSTEERAQRKGTFPYYGASGVIDQIDDYIWSERRLLVSEDGANLLLRSSPIAFVAEGHYWVNNHAHIFEPHDGAHHFWAARIEAMSVAPWVSGSAQPKLTIDAALSLPVSAPQHPEDRVDLGHQVQEIQSRARAQHEQLHRSVSLISEYKQSLITAAVTGKFDVTTASTKIPGE